MWTVKGTSYRWVDDDKYISIQPKIKNGKVVYTLKKYKPVYGEKVVGCLHPFVFLGCNYYIDKLVKQYGIKGLLNMLKKPEGTAKGVQFCVQCKCKKKLKSKYKNMEDSKKSDDRIEKSTYINMVPCDGNASGVMIYKENF